MLLSSTLLGQPPICEPAAMTLTCEEACVVCDIDGFTGRHEGTEDGELPSDFCTNTIHNGRWIAFIAGSVDIEIELFVSNCIRDDNSGLEMGIYRADDCSSFELVSQCYGADEAVRPNTSKIFTNIVPLIIGQHYYLAIDGAREDQCDWRFEVLSGSTQVPSIDEIPEISGNDVICASETQRFSVQTIEGASTYWWTFGDEDFYTTEPFLDLSVDELGSHIICVTPINACLQGSLECFSFQVIQSDLADAGPIDGPSQICSTDDEPSFFSIPLVNGASEYSWWLDGEEITGDENSIEFTSTTLGTHELCVTPSNSCNTGETVCYLFDVIDELENTEAIIGNPSFCENEVITFSIPIVADASSYEWRLDGIIQTSNTVETISLSELQRGDHTVCVTPLSACGAGTQECFDFFIEEQPEVIYRTQSLCPDECYDEDGQLFCEEGVFSYTIPTNSNCDQTIEVTLENNELTLDYPTAFATNGNDANEGFGYIGGLDCEQLTISEYTLTVFDRWGNIVYKSQSIDDYWDGKNANQNLATGLFLWHVSYMLGTNPQEQSGSILVIR